MEPASRPHFALSRSRFVFTPEQARRAEVLVTKMEEMAKQLTAMTPGFFKHMLPPAPLHLSVDVVVFRGLSPGSGRGLRVPLPSPGRLGAEGVGKRSPFPFRLELVNQFANLADDCAGFPGNTVSPAANPDAILPIHRPRSRRPRGKKAQQGKNDTTNIPRKTILRNQSRLSRTPPPLTLLARLPSRRRRRPLRRQNLPYSSLNRRTVTQLTRKSTLVLPQPPTSSVTVFPKMTTNGTLGMPTPKGSPTMSSSLVLWLSTRSPHNKRRKRRNPFKRWSPGAEGDVSDARPNWQKIMQRERSASPRFP